MRSKYSFIKALVFDVFGTVVDWRGSIIREVRSLARAKKFDLDPAQFADAWRAGYQPAMAKVRSGTLGWTKIDALHRMILDDLLVRFGVSGLAEAEIDHLNRVWHRLAPWPDARAGLKALKKTRAIGTLSNGNVSLLVNMAKSGGLPWDVVFSGETFRHYKPDRETYLGACELLSLAPAEVMMVAAHKNDLVAASACGLATAFVRRPLEFGPDVKKDLKAEKDFDINCNDFLDLARRLGP
ncbi:MAG: haloacid dehalogenase type II [Betaproteobacteria bacterium]